MRPDTGEYRRFRRRINILLIGLVLYDIALSATCLISPQTWFQSFHGADYVDPQGLLYRTGAVWVAFSLFQLVARLKWEVQPVWLAVVAGIRLTEIFSDWTYIYVAENLTRFGWFALFVNPPGNLLLGWYLLKSYRRAYVEFACDFPRNEER
jgi:hypothetical protein